MYSRFTCHFANQNVSYAHSRQKTMTDKLTKQQVSLTANCHLIKSYDT